MSDAAKVSTLAHNKTKRRSTKAESLQNVGAELTMRPFELTDDFCSTLSRPKFQIQNEHS